ncbi:MAG: hypothetical protein KJ727_12755 [Acidobacteria bacterium]|nr:hypothetical protein [Acidobacteriota bacterium]
MEGQFSDTSLKLIGKFCPHQKFAQRKEVGGKKIFVFSSCFAKKGEQARSAGNGRHEVAEVRAPRLLGGWGEDSASLPDRSIYFFRLRAEADETEQKIIPFLKICSAHH